MGYNVYEVLRTRVLSGTTYAVPGDTVYDQKGYDYGLSNDDSRLFGIEHVSVTKNSDGSYPGFTIPKRDLRVIGEYNPNVVMEASTTPTPVFDDVTSIALVPSIFTDLSPVSPPDPEPEFKGNGGDFGGGGASGGWESTPDTSPDTSSYSDSSGSDTGSFSGD